jgi:hypothetical protein
MPKRLRNIVLGVTISLLSKMLNPPPHQGTPRDDSNNPAAEQIKRVTDTFDSYARHREAAEAKNSKHNRKIRWWTRRATIGAWIYTAITALIFVVTIRSIQEARRATHAASRAADAASRQADISADTEKRQLRAFVVASAVGSLENFVRDGAPRSTVTFENVGQTPVYSGKWKSGFGVLPYPQIEEPTWPDCQFIASANGFDSFFGRQTIPDKTASWRLTQEHIDRINIGDEAIYFEGRFCYEDIFTDQHYTDFCFVWPGNGHGGLSAPYYCQKGNGGDRTPPRAGLSRP